MTVTDPDEPDEPGQDQPVGEYPDLPPDPFAPWYRRAWDWYRNEVKRPMTEDDKEQTQAW